MYPFEDHLEVKYAQVTPLVCVVKVRLIQCIFFINSQSVLYSFYIFYPNPLENYLVYKTRLLMGLCTPLNLYC